MVNGKIWLSSPTMHGDEMPYIQEAFDQNWVAPLGPNVTAFENETAEKVKVGHAAALSAGTAALHLAVKLAGVRPGDVVFCSDMTFAATVNPVSYEGGRQVFIDSERETWNMDPQALRLAFDRYPNCRAVMCADLYGTPAKLQELRDICDEHGAVLIEDAAEAFGASYRGKMCGSFGQYNVLSYNGNKIITTSGGGMLLSDDGAAIEKARFWATQARDPAPWYQHSEIGYNYRMSNIVAGIGRAQLRHLEEHVAAKTEIYRRYVDGLGDLVDFNPYLSDSVPNFWLSCMKIRDKSVSPFSVLETLAAHKIESRPIWKPMHLQPVFAGHDFISVGQPVDEEVFEHGLCLPSDIKMTQAEQDTVIELIRSCLR